MLEDLGLGEAPSAEAADVVVFNTCTVRQKPDERFAAHLAQAAALKRADPDRVIAVGGCYAEAQRERIFELYPYVDVAFGPDPSRISGTGSVRTAGESRAGGSGLEERSFAAQLPHVASVRSRRGCRSRWAATRSARTASSRPFADGRSARRPGDIVAEVTRLAADGVREVTLLGQNVNSWGRDLLPDIRTEFGELLRAVDAVPGIERIRFTSPHPKDFREPVIAAMAECAAVCEHTHLPLQSGSTRVLKAMRRTYSKERYIAPRSAAPGVHPGPGPDDGHHRGLPGGDRGRLPGDARGRGGGRLRRGVHVRLQSATWHRGGHDGRAGAGRGET